MSTARAFALSRGSRAAPTVRSPRRSKRRRAPVLVAIVAPLALAVPPPLAAQCPDPAAYYAGIDSSTRAGLIDGLHDLIDDHNRVPWDSSSDAVTTTWTVLEDAQEFPAGSGFALDIYKNELFTLVDEDRPYQREHSWPSSYGFPRDTRDAHNEPISPGVHHYPHTDCHALFLAYGGYNGSRGNRPYADVEPCAAADCYWEPWQTEENFGQGGDTGSTYPGWANWRTLSPDSRSLWETWMGGRGDVARAQFYMDVRYRYEENLAGDWEPELTLIEDPEVVKASADSTDNQTSGLMGVLSHLLLWHYQDPVGAFEVKRHDKVCDYQHNRNPFVDRPGYAYCAFLGWCRPDLWLANDDGVVQVVPGETLTYTLAAGSLDDMMGAVVSDVLDPAAFDTAAASWTCAPAPGADPFTTCPAAGAAGALAAGVPITIKGGDSVLFTVAAPLLATAAGSVANTATIAPPLGLADPSPGDNQSTDVDQVLAAGSCGAPVTWDLSGRVVDEVATFEACDSLLAGDFSVQAPQGDATLRAGVSIVLAEGFVVDRDCAAALELDLSLATG